MNKLDLTYRIVRGWTIVKNSWSVIRSSKPLLFVAILGFLVKILILISLFIFGFRTHVSGTFDSWGIYPKFDALSVASIFIAYTLMILVDAFFTGVISDNVLSYFNNRPTSLTSSFKAAWRKKKSLLLFGIVSSIIGYGLITIAERLPFGGKLLTWVGEVSWTAASFFAVPIIMAHENKDVSPKRAVRESSNVLKGLWKEGISSQLSIGFILLIAIPFTYIVLVLIMQLAYTVSGSPDGVPILIGMASFAVVIIGIIGVLLTFNLIGLVARCALLYYGQNKKDPQQYDLSIMKAGMTVNKARKLFS
jgi:hypothetical protein